jgi:hypothetical protein
MQNSFADAAMSRDGKTNNTNFKIACGRCHKFRVAALQNVL